ncbi:hypothetical protein JKY72_05615 [Candidatus Gracilibacteria bacterium]|nr:hypothetical protein [Candidatus Gracilibacteria bacterium]
MTKSNTSGLSPELEDEYTQLSEERAQLLTQLEEIESLPNPSNLSSPENLQAILTSPPLDTVSIDSRMEEIAKRRNEIRAQMTSPTYGIIVPRTQK